MQHILSPPDGLPGVQPLRVEDGEHDVPAAASRPHLGHPGNGGTSNVTSYCLWSHLQLLTNEPLKIYAYQARPL